VKGSNSGIYRHGLYEVRIFDSFGFDGPLTVGDCGGIYEQTDGGGGGGSPPSPNAAKPPGEWQSLRIWFQAPASDSAGKMMAKPKLLRVMLNGVPVQEVFTLNGPTLGGLNIPPAARNPIRLQGTTRRWLFGTCMSKNSSDGWKGWPGGQPRTRESAYFTLGSSVGRGRSLRLLGARLLRLPWSG
jgi:hypothetical protein